MKEGQAGMGSCRDKLKIFAGNSNRPLAQEMAEYLGLELGGARVEPFPDKEILVEITENVRGADAFIVQSTCPPVNDNLMELLLMADALRRASARRITAVIPYYGYARQDRKVKPRVPISSKLVANLISKAGVDRVLAMDLHAGQIQGFFDIPVDHLFAAPVLIDYFLEKDVGDIVVVSPDAGGVERARAFAKRLGASIAIVDKRRTEDREAEVMHVVGDVNGKVAIIVDDMIDRASTLAEAMRGLKDQGARAVYYSATHAVFSPPALERISEVGLKEVVVTNTIPLRDEKAPELIKVLSVAKMLGEAVARIHSEESVSSLFV